MKQVRLKLKAAKGRVTQVLNKLEPAGKKFEDYEKGRERLIKKAKCHS